MNHIDPDYHPNPCPVGMLLGLAVCLLPVGVVIGLAVWVLTK